MTTVLFLDLSSFTALTDVHGDQAAVGVAERFLDAVEVASAGEGGRVIKTLGDGALLVVDDGGGAVRTAARTSEALHGLDSMPELTGGAATGSVVARDGDVIGATVNFAARLAGLAPPGELRVDRPTAQAAAEDGWRVEPLGPQEIRGFHRPRDVFQLLLCHPDDCVVDPVCGMRITPGEATPSLATDTDAVWFCSSACRDWYSERLAHEATPLSDPR